MSCNSSLVASLITHHFVRAVTECDIETNHFFLSSNWCSKWPLWCGQGLGKEEQRAADEQLQGSFSGSKIFEHLQKVEPSRTEQGENGQAESSFEHSLTVAHSKLKIEPENMALAFGIWHFSNARSLQRSLLSKA